MYYLLETKRRGRWAADGLTPTEPWCQHHVWDHIQRNTIRSELLSCFWRGRGTLKPSWKKSLHHFQVITRICLNSQSSHQRCRSRTGETSACCVTESYVLQFNINIIRDRKIWVCFFPLPFTVLIKLYLIHLILNRLTISACTECKHKYVYLWLGEITKSRS